MRLTDLTCSIAVATNLPDAIIDVLANRRRFADARRRGRAFDPGRVAAVLQGLLSHDAMQAQVMRAILAADEHAMQHSLRLAKALRLTGPEVVDLERALQAGDVAALARLVTRVLLDLDVVETREHAHTPPPRPRPGRPDTGPIMPRAPDSRAQ